MGAWRSGAAALVPLLALLAGCVSPAPLGPPDPGQGLPGAETFGPGPRPETTPPAPPPLPPPPAPTGPWPPANGTKLFQLRPFLQDLDRPVGILHAGDGSGRLFVIEKVGRVRVWQDGALLEAPFLNITGRVSLGNEQGLLAIAFPPDFDRSGRVYVHFTDLEGDTRIVRFTVDAADPNRVDPASERPVLFLDQPFEMHNGGPLAFGPDGYLYVALGDGGEDSARARDLGQLFGKVLRLDVSGASGYRSPADNPFAGQDGARPETWAFGFRNPWRMSFDRATGDLWVGDVGYNTNEEVNLIPAGTSGQDFGWDVWEGTKRNKPGDLPDATFPVAQFTHEEGCAVMGGFVYRGQAIPELRGTYLYGDFCHGTIWGLRQDAEGAWRSVMLEDGPGLLTGFGEDEQGELYLTFLRGKGLGYVWRMLPP